MKVVKHLFTLSFIAMFSNVALACPDLWIALGDRCYLVSPDNMDWYAAQQVAHQHQEKI